MLSWEPFILDNFNRHGVVGVERRDVVVWVFGCGSYDVHARQYIFDSRIIAIKEVVWCGPVRWVVSGIICKIQ